MNVDKVISRGKDMPKSKPCTFCGKELKQLSYLSDSGIVYMPAYEPCTCDRYLKAKEELETKELKEEKERKAKEHAANFKARQFSAGIPERFRSVTLRGSEQYEEQKDAREKLINVYNGTDLGFVLEGKTGRGKTHLVCAMLNGMIKCGLKVSYVRATRLGMEYGGTESQDKLKRLLNADMIILDDLHLVKESSGFDNVFNEILNQRYEEKKGLGILSCKSIVDVIKADDNARRVLEICGEPITIDGKVRT